MEYKSKNVDDTLYFASIVAKYTPYGSIILLNGDLGAGKTTFVKGFAKALNITEKVTSPTFTILKKYEITDRNSLIHVDAYRLENTVFEELEDYVSDDNIVLIEWSNNLANQDIFDNYLAINLTYVSKNQRKITLICKGNKYQEIINRVKENV